MDFFKEGSELVGSDLEEMFGDMEGVDQAVEIYEGDDGKLSNAWSFVVNASVWLRYQLAADRLFGGRRSA